MKRILTALVAVFLLLSIVSPALAAPDVEVHAFGYDQNRKRQAEDFSWALFYDEYKEAGRSHSQPLIIKESDGKAKIVLMAGIVVMSVLIFLVYFEGFMNLMPKVTRKNLRTC